MRTGDLEWEETGMDDGLKRFIVGWLEGRVEAVGFAPVDRFHEAPEAHHPSRICKDAKSVIVFGRTVPRGVLSSPDYGLYLLHRSYHSVYPYLDEVGMDLANRIEAEGHLAVQLPSYAPLVYHGMEPWGILSLKHSAVLAGLGAFGRSGMVYHPRYGSLLRLGAVVTDAEMPGDPMILDDPCPSKCHACQKVCPARAFQDGSFQKLQCMTYTIRHGIYPLALRDEVGRKNLETIINTAGYNYWIKCNGCLNVCPINQKKGSS
jgi:epoxyqueuosine reductase QueG